MHSSQIKTAITIPCSPQVLMKKQHINDHKDVLKEISSKVNNGNQFFITAGQKAAFSHILSL